MIVLWTLAKGFVGVMIAWAWLSVRHFQRRTDHAEKVATDPSGEWCELEQLEAKRDHARLTRRLKRAGQRLDGWRARSRWLSDLRKGRLSYVAAVTDASLPWVFWALERSGTFDLWDAAAGVGGALVSLWPWG